ncbi:MAG: amidohydrolase family protein [Acidobacteria bacterium]|nr:amidohydrolase family protein [Acidobacteriota bacterium]
MPEWSGPAFVDLQVNGFAGVDYNAAQTSSDAVSESLDAMCGTGVGLCLPTIITSTFEHFRDCARRVLAARHPLVAGLHMEGPYISPVDGPRGAHPRRCVRDASVDDFRRRQEAADGQIRLLTLAPESPGALAVIEAAVRDGVRVAIGHSAASSDQIGDAVRAGATLSTHLGNGCATMQPRHPNLIWDQLADDRLQASLIADGHHLPPATFRVMTRAKSPTRCLLITDAMMAANAPPGTYRLGDLDVIADASGRVSAAGALTLAGSALTMPEAVGHASRWTGVPLAVAAAMASTQPATYLGRAPRGQVEVVWSDDLSQVRSVRYRAP